MLEIRRASLASAGTFLGAATNFKAIPKGHNAALIDSDGVRRSPALVCVDDAVYPALSVAVSCSSVVLVSGGERSLLALLYWAQNPD